MPSRPPPAPIALALALLAAGCADATDVADDPAAPASEPTTSAEQQATAVEARPIDASSVGRIEGHVLFDGTAPERKPLALGSAAGCRHDHEGEPRLSESVIVTAGRLQNVFVYVKKGLDGWRMPPPPSEPVVLDQRGCVYVPHVFGIRVGQPLLIRNSDPATHNVHSRARRNPSFNQPQPEGAPDIARTFERREVMFDIGCDIHPWMRTWVGVLEHPFFAVSAADGSFAIEGLPPGAYTVEGWHERLGKQRAEVVVPANGTAALELTFEP